MLGYIFFHTEASYSKCNLPGWTADHNGTAHGENSVIQPRTMSVVTNASGETNALYLLV